MDFLAVQQIVVKVPESSSGVSTESILVFIGGVLAATAAVAASIITTKGASSRLEQQLKSERERFNKQLAAESERFASQFAHERYLARRAEASSSVEQITRVIARSAGQSEELMRAVMNDSKLEPEAVDAMSQQLEEVREEANLLAIRFGDKRLIVEKMLEVLSALEALFSCAAEAPLNEDQKKELKARRKVFNGKIAAFLAEAKGTLENYS